MNNMVDNMMGTNVITQIGILVNDIEQAAKDYAEFLGVDVPDIYITDTEEIAKTQYQGKASSARTKQAFFHVGPNLDIELLEPDAKPSTWRHDLDTYGEGIHHIAFVINGMKKVVSALEMKGFKEIQKGEWVGGRYSYIDTRDKLKVLVELLEIDN